MRPSNITILHYYIITKCLFLTIGYNNIFIYKYIIIKIFFLTYGYSKKGKM